jgi:hypothetical protein
MCFTGKWLGEAGGGHTWFWLMHEKSWKKKKTFHIATIKWLIVHIHVLIPDSLSNIYLLEVEIYSRPLDEEDIKYKLVLVNKQKCILFHSITILFLYYKNKI